MSDNEQSNNSDSDYEYDKDEYDEDEYTVPSDPVSEALYNDAYCFDDLLEINVKFLKNEIPRTYYYGAPFGNCLDHEPRRPYLVELHTKYRIYTINGQANVNTPTLIQYSYLQFIVEPKYAAHLAVRLIESKLIYTSIISKRGSTDNFPKEMDRYTNWWRNNDYYESLMTAYENVTEILDDCTVFFIVVKDNTGQETDEILREILEDLKLEYD